MKVPGSDFVGLRYYVKVYLLEPPEREEEDELLRLAPELLLPEETLLRLGELDR
jgi:hypothetical protein